MEDYCDGEAFKSHPLFSLHASALQILFYFDEVEVCNPIGTKAKIHKLGTYLYFTHVCFMLAVCVIYTFRSLLFNSWQLTTKVQIPTVIYTSGCTSYNIIYWKLWNGFSFKAICY